MSRGDGPGRARPGPFRERNQGLDLLRGIAIGLVLIAHFIDRATWAHLGFTPVALALMGHFGVELFFVLSGFLIGNLIIDIIDDGPTVRAWAVFMARRIMRTMPAYLIWIGLLLALKSVGQSGPYIWQYATFMQNLAWPMPPGNWFGVSWSLTIEEWFYLLFSVSTLGLAAIAPRAGFWLSLSAFLVVPVVLRATWPDSANWDETLRKIVVLRLDAIAYGVLLARVMRDTTLLDRQWRAALALGLALLGAVSLVWLVVIGRWDVADPVWRVLVFNVSSVGLMLVFPAAMRLELPHGRFAAGIATASTLSYGLYLNHVPMLDLTRWFYRAGLPLSLAGLALALAGAILLAWLSWRFVEKPILALRPRQSVRAG